MYRAIPLGFDPGRPHTMHVAMMDPLNLLAVDELGTLLGSRVIPVVAPELVVLGMLERLYGVRQPRRSGGPAQPGAALGLGGTWVMQPAPPQPPALAADLRKTLPSRMWPVGGRPPPAVAAPAAPAAPAPSPELYQTQASRIWPVADGLPPAASAARIEARPVIGIGPSAPAPAPSIEDVLIHLSQTDDRDQVGDVVTGYLGSHFGCGLMLVIKEGFALGWRGCAPGADRDIIESIVVPLNVPSVFQIAFAGHRVFRGSPPPVGEAIHTRLWRLLHAPTPREVIVAPVMIGDRVINLLYAHGRDGGTLPPIVESDFEHLRGAAAEAYRRAIQKRHAGR